MDKQDFIQFSNRTTRGHSKKIQKKRGDKDVRKFNFSNRIIDQWNSLPEQIVSANNINQLKKLYDEMTQTDGTI